MTETAEKVAESLVEERVMQLQEISKRRNDLLREMFHLIQRRDNLGSVMSIEDEVEDGLQGFLDRFDLQKYPETGYIANLTADEVALPDTPPAYSPVGGPEPELAPEPEPKPDTATPASDSPISEPPASPVAEQPKEESQPQSPEPPQTVIPMDVDDEEEPPSPVTDEVEVAPEEQEVIEVVTSPELSQELRTAPQSPAAQDEQICPTDDAAPEKSPTPALDRIPTPPYMKPASEAPVPKSPTPPTVATREPSTSRESPPPAERSRSPSPALPNDEESALKTEPLDDEVMEVDDTATQNTPPPPVPEATVSWPPAVPAAIQVSKEPSEDQIMNLLGPAHVRSSPVPQYVAEQHLSVDYSIPRPAREPSASFLFKDGEEVMAVDQPVEPPAPYGPEPPYPVPTVDLLPLEFTRRKASKRKRDRDNKNDFRDWMPMSMNKWAAILKANPVYHKMLKATKTLSTRDWSVGMTELRLIRVFETIEKRMENGTWSFRQPKRQRGVGGLGKTHWDYLMDEMKLMRTDFREERRWKLALAYGLAHAVLEWHDARTVEERVRRGIVVLWRRPALEDTEMADEGDQADGPFRDTQDTDENGADSRETDTPLDGYATDDESDDEPDKQDALAPAAALQEALQQLEHQSATPNSQSAGQDPVALKPKVEEIEDMTALRHNSSSQDDNAMDVDGKKSEGSEAEKAAEPNPTTKSSVSDSHLGLKPTSRNPVVGSSFKEGDPLHGKTKYRINQYAALREQIVYSDVDKLFIDLDDLELVKSMSDLTTEDPIAAAAATAPLPIPHDLSDIFPDLPPYSMPDVAPVQEVRKKGERRTDRDDPNKRSEEVFYTKVYPASKWMHVKPVLMGTAKPAKFFEDGHWKHIEDAPLFVDVDIPPAHSVDDNLCSLFEGPGNRPNVPTAHQVLMPAPPRDVRKRNAEHHDAIAWTPMEDLVLKQAVDRYAYNWSLIADAFNSSRVTISTDKRTPWECVERWRERLNAQARADNREPEDNSPSGASAPASASHMRTRGFQRSAAQNMVASGSGSGSSAIPVEPRKRRRHAAMHETLRKTAKKREAVQKSIAAPRAKTSGVHDTHSQFQKMPRLTPAELSRMKADKEARDAQELILRRKNDELARQQGIRDAARNQSGLPPNTQQPQQSQPQMHPQAPNTNGVPRPANGIQSSAIVPQIRSQVAISQQQRIAANNRTTQLSPSQLQMAQLQLRALQYQGSAQSSAQAQVAAQLAGQTQMSNASAALTAAAPALSGVHLSPSFGPRATSSSPGLPQQSPPLPAASPVNVSATPRPTSVPAQLMPGTSVNPIPHVNQQNMAMYMHRASLTSEQQMALLAQVQQQRQAQLYAAHAQQSQATHPPNGHFPSS